MKASQKNQAAENHNIVEDTKKLKKTKAENRYDCFHHKDKYRKGENHRVRK